MAESGEDKTLHVNARDQQQPNAGNPNVEVGIEEPDIDRIDKVYR
jgi:hypothetical protein